MAVAARSRRRRLEPPAAEWASRSLLASQLRVNVCAAGSLAALLSVCEFVKD